VRQRFKTLWKALEEAIFLDSILYSTEKLIRRLKSSSGSIVDVFAGKTRNSLKPLLVPALTAEPKLRNTCSTEGSQPQAEPTQG
jgi:hypothetical protein